MASRVWDQMSGQAAATREQIRRRMAEVEKQTAAFIDRIVEASSQAVIARYEQRVAELERERLVLAEKLEAKAAPRKRCRSVRTRLVGYRKPLFCMEKWHLGQTPRPAKSGLRGPPCLLPEWRVSNPENVHDFQSVRPILRPKRRIGGGDGIRTHDRVLPL